MNSMACRRRWPWPNLLYQHLLVRQEIHEIPQNSRYFRRDSSVVIIYTTICDIKKIRTFTTYCIFSFYVTVRINRFFSSALKVGPQNEGIVLCERQGLPL
jgi:hypothetical protein